MRKPFEIQHAQPSPVLADREYQSWPYLEEKNEVQFGGQQNEDNVNFCADWVIQGWSRLTPERGKERMFLEHKSPEETLAKAVFGQEELTFPKRGVVSSEYDWCCSH